MRVKVCLISSLFTQFGHNPVTGYKNKKKHLVPPPSPASHLPNIPQWLNNEWLAQTLVCHQIPMLIAQVVLPLLVQCEVAWLRGLGRTLSSRMWGYSANGPQKREVILNIIVLNMTSSRPQCHSVNVSNVKLSETFFPELKIKKKNSLHDGEHK